MTSVSPIAVGDISVADGDLTATQYVNGASLDTDKDTFRLRINALIAALAVSIRDDNRLTDSSVRLYNLDPEVIALLGSGAGNDGTVWQPKVQVACASTANLTLSGEQTIDGILTSASRVLVKDQTLAKDNGIYVTGAGAWTRSTDGDTAAEIGYAMCFVASGTVNGGTSWIGTLAAAVITLGTTSLPFARLPAAASAAVATFAQGGTGQTTPQSWATTRRRAVRAVSTANVVVATPGASIDGVTLASGDRVLLVGQSTGAQNGLWVWNGAASAMTRPVDYADANSDMAYLDVEVLVKEGTVHAGDVYRLTTTGAITIGSTTTAWTSQVTGISADSVDTAQIVDGAATNAKLADMAAATIKGSVAGGAPEDLTGTEATALLNEMRASGAFAAKGLVPVPSATAGERTFLREDAVWKVPPLLRDVFRGLKMVNNTGTPLAKVDITANEAVLQDSSTLPGTFIPIILDTISVTVNLAGVGAGGLDFGGETVSTWYHVWLIYNETTDTVDGLFSLSATAPTMPSGYTYKAYVGAVYNDSGGDLPKFIQRGKVVSRTIVNVVNDFAVTGANTYQTQALTTQIPSTASIAIGVAGNSNNNGITLCVAADTNGVGEIEMHCEAYTVAYNYAFARAFRIPLITAQQMALKASGTGARNRIDINGWEYP